MDQPQRRDTDRNGQGELAGDLERRVEKKSCCPTGYHGNRRIRPQGKGGGICGTGVTRAGGLCGPQDEEVD